ncbi:MAG: hypothetical protein HY812_11810 [Planctomycetes bacterium]|nr:hypothetical protein [Planctomycetota bacterium]
MVLLNIAAPLIQVGPFGLAVLLVPICIVEAVVVRRVAAVPWGKCLRAVLLANTATTWLGFPLGWLLMRGVRAVSGWRSYGHDLFHFPWDQVFNSANYDTWLSMSMSWPTMLVVYAASLLLLVPAYFLSVWVETWICAALLGDPALPVRRAVRGANLVSYALLGALLLALAANNLARVGGFQTNLAEEIPDPVPLPRVER